MSPIRVNFRGINKNDNTIIEKDTKVSYVVDIVMDKQKLDYFLAEKR